MLSVKPDYDEKYLWLAVANRSCYGKIVGRGILFHGSHLRLCRLVGNVGSGGGILTVIVSVCSQLGGASPLIEFGIFNLENR